MNPEKILRDQYSALCQKLGDLTYKSSIIAQEIKETEAQIKALNLVNTSLENQLKASKALEDQRPNQAK